MVYTTTIWYKIWKYSWRISSSFIQSSNLALLLLRLTAIPLLHYYCIIISFLLHSFREQLFVWWYIRTYFTKFWNKFVIVKNDHPLQIHFKALSFFLQLGLKIIKTFHWNVGGLSNSRWGSIIHDWNWAQNEYSQKNWCIGSFIYFSFIYHLPNPPLNEIAYLKSVPNIL